MRRKRSESFLLLALRNLEKQKSEGDNKCTSILPKHKIHQQTSTTFKGPLSLCWSLSGKSLQPQLLKFLSLLQQVFSLESYPTNSYANTVTNAVVLSFEGENVKVLQ